MNNGGVGKTNPTIASAVSNPRRVPKFWLGTAWEAPAHSAGALTETGSAASCAICSAAKPNSTGRRSPWRYGLYSSPTITHDRDTSKNRSSSSQSRRRHDATDVRPWIPTGSHVG